MLGINRHPCDRKIPRKNGRDGRIRTGDPLTPSRFGPFFSACQRASLFWASLIVERIKLKDGGKTMEDTFIMTDPENWEGEWVNTKRWFRYDNSDIEEAY